MKILNLYANIGGNRKLWGDEHDITAVELDPKIAQIYRDFWPNDTVIEGDAHQYLLDHHEETDYPVTNAKYPNGHYYSTYGELRRALMKMYDTCYWCDIKVKDYSYVKGRATPRDQATIDHLIQRPLRKKGEVVGKVLACNRCNLQRSSAKDPYGPWFAKKKTTQLS